MKLIILHSIIEDGLTITSRISPKTFSLPILNNVLIKAEKNFLNLETTDLEIGIKWRALAKIEEESSLTVPSRLFLNLINLLPEKPVYLESKENNLNIQCGDYKTEIKGQSAQDFPIIPQPIAENPITLDSQALSQALSQVVDIPILSSARPEISGIYFAFEKDLIKMVSTDSFRLGEKKLFYEKVKLPIQPFSFILPQKAAREIINIFGEKEEEIKLHYSTNQVLFEIPIPETSHPKIQLISRLVEGEYPDYQAIIPKKYQTKIILSKNEFLNQIKMASLFSGKTNEIKFKIEPKEEKVEIYSQNPESGQYQSFLPGKVEGEGLKVSFNWRFLIDGLLNIKTPELIFELNGEEGPGVLRPVRDDTYLYILMPIKAS